MSQSFHADLGTISLNDKTYGSSVYGTPLKVWLPSGAPELLIFAGIHGEEPEGTVLLSKALRMQAQELRSTAVILCANPDGITLGTRGNANGVDLNRNFPAENWNIDPVHHRWSEADLQSVKLSAGAKAGSEPETQALISLIESLNPKHVVALHGPLNCIDDPHESELGKRLSIKTKMPLVKDIGYPTPGSFGSWALEKNIPVITYEFPNQSVWQLMDIHLPVLCAMLQKGLDCFKD